MADEITDTGSPVTCPDTEPQEAEQQPEATEVVIRDPVVSAPEATAAVGDALRAAVPVSRQLPRGLPAAVASRLDDGVLKRLTTRRDGAPVDVRAASGVELREQGDTGVRISGYASVANYPYPIAGGPEYGGWTETISPRAFDKSLAERSTDVRLLFNHGGIPLARTRPGTLRLSADEVGLRVEADLDMRSAVTRDVVLGLERGDLDSMSFAFSVVRDEWNDDYTERSINEVKLYDASVVTFPANEAAPVYTSDDLKGRAATVGRDEARETWLQRARWLRGADASVALSVSAG